MHCYLFNGSTICFQFIIKKNESKYCCERFIRSFTPYFIERNLYQRRNFASVITDKVSNRIQNAPNAAFAQLFGNPELLGILSGSVLLIAGISFLLGVFIRWSALVLFLVLIPITIIIQVGNGWLHGPFWKNVALFGGLLFFIINNPKEYTLYNPSSLTS